MVPFSQLGLVFKMTELDLMNFISPSSSNTLKSSFLIVKRAVLSSRWNKYFLLEVKIHTSLDIWEKMIFVHYNLIKLRKRGDECFSFPYNILSIVILINMTLMKNRWGGNLEWKKSTSGLGCIMEVTKLEFFLFFSHWINLWFSFYINTFTKEPRAAQTWQ